MADAVKTEFVSNFSPWASRATEEQFAQRFPHPFLVQRGGEEDADGAAEYGTQIIRRPGSAGVGGSMVGREKRRVYRVAKKEGGAFAQMITVGRTPNNDVALIHPSVSKFHAHLQKTTDPNVYFISDAGSTNGTLVNGIRLEPSEKKELQDGDRVSFGGELQYVYHTAPGFFRFLARRL